MVDAKRQKTRTQTQMGKRHRHRELDTEREIQDAQDETKTDTRGDVEDGNAESDRNHKNTKPSANEAHVPHIRQCTTST